MSERPVLSVVIPLRDEEECLRELERRLHKSLDETGLDWEILFVNDGSRDRTLARLRELRARDPRIRFLDLSRGFGHQIAVSAGLDHASGRAVIVMDGDLQDPPELLPLLVARWREGFDVVYAVRRQRTESWWQRSVNAAFYRILRAISEVEIPVDAGDFALLDRRVVDVLCAMPERSRYLRGLRAWAGFRQVGVHYARDERFAGGTKYSLRSRLRLAADAMLAFSDLPLRWLRAAGVAASGIGAVLGTLLLCARALGRPGASDAVLLASWMLFLGGVQLLAVGVLGAYVARIHGEVRGRPRYLVREAGGVQADAGPGGAPTERP